MGTLRVNYKKTVCGKVELVIAESHFGEMGIGLKGKGTHFVKTSVVPIVIIFIVLTKI